jgi:dynein light chain LC8-type
MAEEEGIYLSDIEDYDLDGKTVKPILVRCDLNKETRKKSFELAFEAMNKYSVERDISDYIKTVFDREFSPTWQVIVGIYYYNIIT